MNLKISAVGSFIVVFMVASAPAFPAHAQAVAQPMITGAINDANSMVLSGNTRPEANAANDLGPVAGSFPMQHLTLQLRRPAERERALTALIDQLHDPASLNFHKWLSPQEFGTRFGPAASDIGKVTGWLQSHGFIVNLVYPSGMTIDFSGTAAEVAAAFHAGIHNIRARGATRFANMNDPQIPAALAPVVTGVVRLNNVPPRPNVVHKRRPVAAKVGTAPLSENGYYAVTPPDLATIYNFNPVFTAGNTGQGQTIYLIEDTNLYTNNDWTTFRATFGLSTYSGATLTTIHPQPPSGPANCSDPGVNSDDVEAILDAEYASAAAPSAAIVMATCDNTPDGLYTAIQNLLNAANPPAIISVSYGECEAYNGAASNAAYNSLFQQGVAEGTSIFVSSGDEDAGVCDYNEAAVTHGIGVNALSSTPYNVAVGGTDFSDFYAGTIGTYWNATNTAAYGSAKSYIPEIPWNDSCASGLLAAYSGYGTTYGTSGFCNSSDGAPYLTNGGGSGGPSGCATGSPSISGVVSGTCQGYAKPSWQTGVFGIPGDGVRDQPDVSLFAANGVWSHFYIFCYSNLSFSDNGGAPCTGDPFNWSGAGGTSFAAPIMAGVQALVNKQTGQAQGNPNYRLYQLAAAEYGASGNAACNSSNGNTAGSSCIFYDVTQGDIDSNCTGTYNCYLPSGTYGVLSTSNSSYAPAYGTATGWDFATGIGTVSVNNLVTKWAGAASLAATHDFNGDSKSDILWRDSSGNVAIWLMNGGSVSSSAFVGNIGTTWTVAGQRDFDGDGKHDILWRDGSGNVAVWLMNGGAVSSSLFIGNVPATWSIVGTADFNGDGKGDILWHDSGGNVAIWLMNGGTVSSSVFLGNAPSNWSIIGTCGQGIVWRDTSGNVALWRTSGTTVTASLSLGNVPSNWAIVGSGDFNGDGVEDYLWRDSSGNVAIWLMNGDGTIASIVSLGNVATSWSIAQTGDYNGDGKSDILWLDSSGNVAVWFMNGGTVSSSAFVGNVPGVWSVQAINAE